GYHRAEARDWCAANRAQDRWRHGGRAKRRLHFADLIGVPRIGAAGEDHPLLEVPWAESRMRRDRLRKRERIARAHEFHHVGANLLERSPRLVCGHAAFWLRHFGCLETLAAIAQTPELIGIDGRRR